MLGSGKLKFPSTDDTYQTTPGEKPETQGKSLLSTITSQHIFIIGKVEKKAQLD